MKVEIRRKNELSRKRWSGGTTTELAIWPRCADYAARRFDWRVSTAVVEEERSIFTPLPGIHRHLMILDGEITLSHGGAESVTLKALRGTDEFDGGTETLSVGRCVDFNLMTARGYAGALLVARKGRSAPALPEGAACYWRGLYSLTDALSVKCAAGGEEEDSLLNRGDFLLFSYSPEREGTADFCLRSERGGAVAVAACAEVWRLA